MFDSHLHLSEEYNSATEAIEALQGVLSKNNVEGGILIPLITSKYSLESILEASERNLNLRVVPHINPLDYDFDSNTIYDLASKGIVGIKLHPRLDTFNLTEERVYEVIQIAEELNLTVNICSFWDGTWSRYGLTIDSFGDLADKFPGTRFVWCHFGGHKILDFMMMLRRRDNVFADTSLVQDYFFKGSVKKDLIYSLESLKGKRILFGSDFPEKAYEDILESSVDFYVKFLDEKYRDAILEKILVENFHLAYPNSTLFQRQT